jgi:hypothetical protein
MNDQAYSFFFQVDLVKVFIFVILIKDSSDFHSVYLPDLCVMRFRLSVADMLTLLLGFDNLRLLLHLFLVFLLLCLLSQVAVDKLVACHAVFSEDSSILICLIPLLI